MEHGSAVERYEAFQRLKKKFEVKNERDRPQHSKEILSRNDHFIAGEYSSEKSNTMNEQNSKMTKHQVSNQALERTGEKKRGGIKLARSSVPDADTSATGSVLSCSSGYFSRLEKSSSASLQTGSFSELSDAGSCDTHPENSASPYKASTNQVWTTRPRKTPGRTLLSSTPVSSSSNPAATLPEHSGQLLDIDISSSLCSDSSSPIATMKDAWNEKLSISDLAESSSLSLSGNADPSSTIYRESDVAEPTFHLKDVSSKMSLESDPNNMEGSSEDEGKTVLTIEMPKPRSQPVEREQAASASLNSSKSRSASEQTAQLDRSQNNGAADTTSLHSSLRPSKYGQAYKKYRKLQTLTEHSPSSSKRLVSVKKRAEFFGQKQF